MKKSNIIIAVALALVGVVSFIFAFAIKSASIDDSIKNTIIQKINPEGIEENEEIDIEDNLTKKIVGEASSTIEEIANSFSVKLIETGTLLVLYIAMRIALKYITVLADLIAKLPILKQINKTGRINIWNHKRNCYSICIISIIIFDITDSKNRYN